MKRLFFLVVFLLFPLTAPEARILSQRSVLDNGLILLTSEQRAVPMVTFNLFIDAGSRYDPKGKEGLAYLTARLLTYGTRQRNALQISESLDFVGASLSAGAGEELTTVHLTLLKKDLDVGLTLLGEVLTESVFPEQEVERRRQSVLASIKAKQEDPGEIAQQKFLAALYPGSPYGRPVEGSTESVRRLDRASIREFYGRYYRPNGSILAVVGDISHEEIKQKLDRAFHSWSQKPPAGKAPELPSPGGANILRFQKKLTQANILMGHEGVPRGHPDYYAIRVMNYILGAGGFSSRLMDSIRNERGLAYSVYSHFSADKHLGSFQISMQTKNQTAEEAIRIATEEVKRIQDRGVSEEELQAAKDYLIGSFPLRLDTNRRVAGFLAQVEYYDLGLDYLERYPDLIRRVTREDVHRAAKLYLKPEKFIVVVVGDQGAIGKQ